MARLLPELKSYRKHTGAFAWTGLDQFLSSLSNVIVSLAVARAGGAQALGLYAVAFAIYLGVFGFQRALISEPLLTIAPEDPRRQDEHSRLGLGASLVYVIPITLVVLVVGIATASPSVIVLSAALPLLCVQDLYRHLFFRQRRPQGAALLDGIWVVVSLAGWPLIASNGDAATAVGVWAAGGAVGAIVGAVALRTLPAGPVQSFHWWMREARSLGGFLGMERGLQKIFAQATTLGFAAVLGAEELGLLRGAEIVLGPVGLILTAFQVFILPRLVGRPDLGRRNALVISIVTGGTTLLGAAVLWALSPWLVPLLYGRNFELPAILVLAVGIRMTTQSLSLGPVLQLKADRRGGPIVMIRAITGAIGVALILLTAWAVGLVAAVWMQSVPALAFAAVLFLGYQRDRRSDPAEVVIGSDSATRANPGNRG